MRSMLAKLKTAIFSTRWFLLALAILVVATVLDRDIGLQLLVTALGIVIGLPFALWINRLEEKREARKEAVKETEQKTQLLNALKQAIGHNRDLIGQLGRQMQTKEVPTYKLDLTLLDATASLKYDLLDDVPLCKELDTLHFELAHLQRKLDVYLNMIFDGALRSLSVTSDDGTKQMLYPLLVLHVTDTIKAHLKPLDEKCMEVLQLLE